eukprot:s234_g18.t2
MCGCGQVGLRLPGNEGRQQGSKAGRREGGKEGSEERWKEGTYNVLPSRSSSQLAFSRLTGDKKYTDKMIITLADTGGKCMIMGCSESQVFSFIDFSTNYCNIRNLLGVVMSMMSQEPILQLRGGWLSDCEACIQCSGVEGGLFQRLKAYGVPYVFGVKSGFGGLPEEQNWLELTPEDIHNKGGTVLESERGNARHADMAAMLQTRRCKQLFILGGDGAHKGTLQLASALKAIDHECALVAVPSTVDNDLAMVDTSFGFDTACTEARDCVQAAYVEATCNANCIGLVKLLGLGSGFLAMNATMAARNVDLCLLPEMEIDLEKVLAHCENVMATKGYAVIVVADGAKSSLFRRAGVATEGDVGIWLRDQILARFKEKSRPLTIKYIDPTYMVRSVKANAYDSSYCAALADPCWLCAVSRARKDHAVHAAMAGFTCVSVVRTYMRYVYLPIHACVTHPKRVNPLGRWFGRMAFSTGQPRFEPDGFEYAAMPDQAADLKKISTPMDIAAILPSSSAISRLECVSLCEKFPSKNVDNPIKGALAEKSYRTLFVQSDWFTTQSFDRSGSADCAPRTYLQFQRTGPSREIHFDPKDTEMAAAIVTCGGLCPGLNNVIREIVMMCFAYGMKKVYGIIGGFKGCVEDDKWVELTPATVENIHKLGGSILESLGCGRPVCVLGSTETTEKCLATAHAVLEPGLSREGSLRIGSAADHFENSVRQSLLSLQKEIVNYHNAAQELDEISSLKHGQQEPQDKDEEPPMDIDSMIRIAVQGEERGFRIEPSSSVCAVPPNPRQSRSSNRVLTVSTVSVAAASSSSYCVRYDSLLSCFVVYPAGKWCQLKCRQDGRSQHSQQDVVSTCSKVSNERAIHNWAALIFKASSDFRLAKRMQIPSDPALQLHPLWLAKQQTKQAGFAAASNLRLNISTALKTGDRRMDASSCLQPYIMNPYGAKRLGWGLLGVVMILWDLVVIPLTVFELGGFEGVVDVMGYITFSYWFLDLAGSFLVGSDMEGTLEMRPGPIAVGYLRTWFFPDLLIIILDVVLFIVTSMASESDGAEAAETFRIARGLRCSANSSLKWISGLLRLHKAATIVDVIQMRMRSEYLTLLVKMLRQSMLIIVVNHYIACAWFSVSDLINQDDTWVTVFGVKNAGLQEQYLTSFHWSLTQFAPATNNIAPQNWIERAFASCIVIYAFVAFSSFVSAVTNAANELRAFTMRSSQQEVQIRRKVSSDLWCRIRKFCQEANSRARMITEQEQKKGKYFRQLEIFDIAVFNEIPESLRIVLHEELYRDFFREAHIFSGFQEPLFIRDLTEGSQIVKRVCHFCFEELAVHAKLDVFVDGTEADKVFVSRSGSATYWSVLLDNRPSNCTQAGQSPATTSLKSFVSSHHKPLTGEGHWLCELALWARWSHRGQLVADTTVRFLTLKPQSFATVAASEGGSFFAYLRSLGLLLIGYAEENNMRITDLTLGEILIRAFAKRAVGFANLNNDDGNKSLRITSLSSLSPDVARKGNNSRPAVRKVMQRRNIRQYYVLGGDGTHKGAMQSFKSMTEIGHECAVVGVPKTIDNDITLVDRSAVVLHAGASFLDFAILRREDRTFGFDTACTEARKAIDSAYIEATTNANCIGLVKLMGRHCGWIASTATIAARNVDICLIPEMNISLPKVMDYVAEVMRRQKYAVIVVAEGCGDTLITSDGGKDAGGNKVLADIGPFLKDAITKHLKSIDIPVSIKYIDPTYMIRAVPANAFDSIYCSVLAQMAVHAAMAGYTGISEHERWTCKADSSSACWTPLDSLAWRREVRQSCGTSTPEFSDGFVSVSPQPDGQMDCFLEKLRVCAMGRFGSACLLLATSAVCAEVPWKAWLQSFGHDSFRYPAWIKEQKEACHCRIHDRLHVQCWGKEDNAVMWQTARELDWCVARQFLLSHMPEFDLHFLPGSVSVDGESMLDDNIAFALMAWNASNLNPRPPMAVALPYLLPYASYHEARSNWRPLFFAKYFSAAAELQSSQAVVDALIGDGVRLMNWTSFKWADFPGKSESNIYELGPFASGSTPPVVAPADFLLYGYGSCTAWAKFLSSALRAVGVPAREVGSPCWNTGIFTGLAESNINVSLCWQGGVSGGPVGGKYLNNHNWVEYWDNAVHTWRFLDVATSSSSETTWFCGKFQDGCSCTSNAGLAMQIILSKPYMALANSPFQPYAAQSLTFGPSLALARRDNREASSLQLGCRRRGQAALHLCLAGVGWQRAGGKVGLRPRASKLSPHGCPRKASAAPATELDGHMVSPLTGSPHRYTLIYLHGLGGTGGSYVSADSELELPWRLGESYAPGLRAVLPSAPNMEQPWGEELASWYVYRALTSNEVADAESLASVRRALDEVIRNEVRRLDGDGRRVFLGGISQGCNIALDAYLRLASTLNLGGFVGSVGFLPSDRQGFPGSDMALRTLLEDSRQALQPVWLQSAPGDMDEVPYDLVQSSLLRARSGWAGLHLQNIEGVGHDIGQFEASFLNEFLRQHASDAYFEDHEILAPTWSAVGDDPDVHGGPILDVAKDLVLSSGEAVSPLVWSPRLTSPLGIPMKNVGLRVVNRTTFYRCRKLPNWTV